MDAVQEILGTLPVDQLAAQTGTDPATVQELAGQLIPALLGGMSANADDTAGARSLGAALTQHRTSPLLSGSIELGQVDTDDGQAIVHNVFGAHTPQVTQRLGAQFAGGNSELVQTLLRYLAPIVLAYLAKKLGGGGQSSQQGSGLPDLILDLLRGGGRPAPAPAPAPAPTSRERTFDPPAPSAPGVGAPTPPLSGGDAPAPDQIPLDGPTPTPAPAGPSQRSGGGLLEDLLGGLLGGGRRS